MRMINRSPIMPLPPPTQPPSATKSSNRATEGKVLSTTTVWEPMSLFGILPVSFGSATSGERHTKKETKREQQRDDGVSNHNQIHNVNQMQQISDKKPTNQQATAMAVAPPRAQQQPPVITTTTSKRSIGVSAHDKNGPPRMPAIDVVVRRAPPTHHPMERTCVQTLQEILFNPAPVARANLAPQEGFDPNTDSMVGRDSTTNHPTEPEDADLVPTPTPPPPADFMMKNNPAALYGDGLRDPRHGRHNSSQPAKRTKVQTTATRALHEPRVVVRVQDQVQHELLHRRGRTTSPTSNQNNGTNKKRGSDIHNNNITGTILPPTRTTTAATIKGETSTTTAATAIDLASTTSKWTKNLKAMLMSTHQEQQQPVPGCSPLLEAPHSPVRYRPGYNQNPWNDSSSNNNVNGSPVPSPANTRRTRSRAIAIKRRANHPFGATLYGTSSSDDFPSSQSEHSSERMYDWATWRMYNRIVDHRRNQQLLLLKNGSGGGMMAPLGAGGGGVYPPASSVPHQLHHYPMGTAYEPTGGLGAWDYIHDGEVFELDDI